MCPGQRYIKRSMLIDLVSVMLHEVLILLDLLWESCGKDNSSLWKMLDDKLHQMVEVLHQLALAPVVTDTQRLDII